MPHECRARGRREREPPRVPLALPTGGRRWAGANAGGPGREAHIPTEPTQTIPQARVQAPHVQPSGTSGDQGPSTQGAPTAERLSASSADAQVSNASRLCGVQASATAQRSLPVASVCRACARRRAGRRAGRRTGGGSTGWQRGEAQPVEATALGRAARLERRHAGGLLPVRRAQQCARRQFRFVDRAGERARGARQVEQRASAMSVAARTMVWVLRLYRAARVRPPACRFDPTCSSYAVTAVARYGALRGGWLAAKRVGRCRPWGGFGYDPVPEA